MKVKIFHKIAYKFVFCPHISWLMQEKGYFLDTDKFWHRLDIMALMYIRLLMNKISQNVETKSRRIPETETL